MRRQSGQALVEWAISALVLILFAFGILAVGQVVGQYMAVRSAASQAALAAARAPSAADAQSVALEAAEQAIAGNQVRDFKLTLDVGGFQRGQMLTAKATGCVGLDPLTVVSQALGQCVRLRWTAHALIEPYRSRTP
jgi:Flp pilus assembly protein TadG